MLFAIVALAAANPATINKPRQDFAACIRAFEQKSAKDKMTVEAYGSGVKGACAAEADRLTQALVAYDIAMGGKRSTALSNAAADVADYRTGSADRFKDLLADAPQ